MISQPKKFFDILVIILIIVGLGFSLFLLSSKTSIKLNQPRLINSPDRNNKQGQLLCQGNLNKVQPVDLGNLPPYGNPQAPIKIIEFSDYLCPFCARTAVEFYPKIEDLVKEGKIAIYYRDFVVHKEAEPIAIAARCANEQGKFWEFNVRIFEKLLTDKNITQKETWLETGKEIGLNLDQLTNCIDQNKFKQDIDNDLNYSLRLGLNGTPTFFVQSKDKAFQVVGIDEACLMSAINELQK